MQIENSKQNGITIIALVITIIVLLVLVGASVTIALNGGLFTNAKKASFYQEMSAIEEKNNQKLKAAFDEYADQTLEDNFLGENLTTEELQELDETLKAEIIYIRNAFGSKERFTTQQVWNNNMFECQENYSVPEYLEGLSENIYYITKNASGKEKTYIYDSVSDTCFKIPNTKIGKYVVHSLQYAKFIIDGIDAKGVGTVEFEAGIKESSDGTLAYEPDLNNFSYATQIVYYSSDFREEYTMPIKEFIEKGKPSTQNIEGQTYTFADYTDSASGKAQVWANVKTIANGLESYWVWIPRYAYKLDENKKSTYIIFVNLENKQMDGTDLPEDYTVHEAFKQDDGLKGIWFSKYEPTPVETVQIDQTEPTTPNLSNFNTEQTKIIYYTADGKNYIEKAYTANPAQTIQENGTTYYWYNYINKIWANIKTTANGLESWWVWIPRYAYKLESGTTQVIFIDENNKPIDTESYGEEIPTGYTVHEAFKQDDGLKGIWFSKYEPTPVTIE